jgi:hypothetical protein
MMRQPPTKPAPPKPNPNPVEVDPDDALIQEPKDDVFEKSDSDEEQEDDTSNVSN